MDYDPEDPIEKKGKVVDHFGDLGEEIRKRGRKIREAESSDLTDRDGPTTKFRTDADEQTGVGPSAGAASRQ